MQRSNILFLVFLALTSRIAAAFSGNGEMDTSSYNRPKIHYTPETGWMNDPNGLMYDKTDEVWHMYFQYNPNDTIWGQPLYWGHATSKDLIHWDHHKVAISPDHDDEGIFSGSIVIDKNNTSGFFNDSIDKNQRIVAIYSNNAPDSQTQDVAYSLDKGETFIKYKQNPVIDANSTQFRDPKVFWHDETSQWIMAVLKSQEFKIQIFGSKNLKEWNLHSNFSSGFFGNQYECPGLIQVPIENSNKSKWVMFLAINPGSPIGGSSNQYFIGDFDGFTFTQDDSFTRLMDSGKDFYAFQTFSDNDNGVIGLAWASNWQYANVVPTHPWRSSMTLARNYTLRYVNQNVETEMLTLVQKPVLGSESSIKTTNSLEEQNYKLSTEAPIKTDFNSSVGFLDFNVTFKVLGGDFGFKNNTKIEIMISSQESNSTKESIKLGFDSMVAQFYFDRNTPNVELSNNPYFTKTLSTYVEPSHYDKNELPVYNVYGIVDRNILELYFNDGVQTMTNTFFMSEGKFPEQIEIVTGENDLFELEYVSIRELST